MMKRNIWILWGIALLQGMVFYAPVATLYRQAAGLGIFHITVIESISLWLSICLEIPWGWTADRIGYRKSMLICCFLFFVSKVIFWQATGFPGFLLERILLSVVCAGLSGLDTAVLYQSCDAEESHKVFSIYEALGQLGMVFAAVVYACRIGENYRLAAFLTMGSYGAAALLSLGLKEVGPRTGKAGRHSVRELLKLGQVQLGNPKVLLLLAAAGLFNESHQTITVFLSQLQYVRAGMTHRGISLGFLLANAAALSGGLSAVVCGKAGVKRVGITLLLLAGAGCAVLGLFPTPVLSVGAVVLIRICHSLMQPLQMDLQNRLVVTEDRATALSMNAVVLDGIGIFLNLLFGRLADRSLAAAMFLGAGFCGLSAVLYGCSFGFRKKK